MRYRGASRSVKASTICCATHSDVGCSVTPKRSTFLRWCSTTRNTKSTRNLTVGTVKKSVATISPMWFCRKVFQVCDGGRGMVRRMRETVRSETFDPEFEQFAVNAWCTPQAIRTGHGFNQLANLFADRRPAQLPPRPARQSCPMLTETLPLPARHGVWVNHK